MSIRTPNYGLFEGIANGVNQGLLTYQNQKNIQHQRQMEGLMNGVETDEHGNPTGEFAPWKKAQMDTQASVGQYQSENAKRQLGLLHAGSPESLEQIHGMQQAYDASHAGMKNYNGPKGADVFPETMSGQGAIDLAGKGLIGKDVSGEYGLLKTMFSPMVGARMDANQMRANNAYDSVIGKKYEDRLDAANRVRDLIKRSIDGTLIPSENLGQQLAADINMLQSGHTSVAGTEHSKPNTLYGKAGQFIHMVSGQPTPAITGGDLGQMLKEADILYGDIGDQHKSKFSSWVKGQPSDVRPLLLDRFNESRRQYFPPEMEQSSRSGLLGQPKESSGKIQVSNGKETLEIPTSDEAAAAADGYRRVK